MQVPPLLPIPVFEPLSAPDVPVKFASPQYPVLVAAYSTAIQDYLDNRLSTWDTFFFSLNVLVVELRSVKDPIFRRYRQLREELMDDVGSRNVRGLSGSIIRKLNTMAIEERKEISDKMFAVADNRSKEIVDALDWIVKAGITSAQLRAETSNTLQNVNLDLLNVYVDTALKVAVQNVEQYNSYLKLLEIITEEEAVESRVDELSYRYELSALLEQKVMVEVETVKLEVETVQYELQTIAAKLVAAEYKVLLAQAQVLTAYAQKELAEAKELYALAKLANTPYEIEKALAKYEAALSYKQKIYAQLEGIAAQTAKDQILEDSERAELDLNKAEKELALAKDEYDIIRTNAQKAISDLRKTILEQDKITAQTEKDQIRDSTKERIDKTAELMDKRMLELVSDLSKDFNSVRGNLNRAYLMYKTTMDQIRSKNKDNIIQRAKNSANQTLTSVHYKTEGEPPEGVGTGENYSPSSGDDGYSELGEMNFEF